MSSFTAFATVGKALAGRASTSSSSSSSSARRIVAAAAPARRFLSEDATADAPSLRPAPAPTPEKKAKKGGSSFFQRLGAFLTGAGVGCGVGYYHLATEIKGSTAALEKAIAKNHSDLSGRLDRLEK